MREHQEGRRGPTHHLEYLREERNVEHPGLDRNDHT